MSEQPEILTADLCRKSKLILTARESDPSPECVMTDSMIRSDSSQQDSTMQFVQEKEKKKKKKLSLCSTFPFPFTLRDWLTGLRSFHDASLFYPSGHHAGEQSGSSRHGSVKLRLGAGGGEASQPDIGAASEDRGGAGRGEGQRLTLDRIDEEVDELMQRWTVRTRPPPLRQLMTWQSMEPEEMRKAELRTFNKLQRSLIFPRA
eukprot:766541-Hanusia_phi.AAC.6